MIVTNEEVFYLDVLSPFGSRNITVLSQGKRAHVVSKNNVISDSVSLHLKKMPHSENVHHLIV